MAKSRFCDTRNAYLDVKSSISLLDGNMEQDRNDMKCSICVDTRIYLITFKKVGHGRAE